MCADRQNSPPGPAARIRFLALLGYCCLVGIIVVDVVEPTASGDWSWLWVVGKWGLVLTASLVVYRLLFIAEHGVFRPLAETAEFLEKMAEGSFHQELPVHSQDEIGQVRHSINQVAQKVNGMSRLVEEINSGATFEETLDYIFASMHGYIPYDRIGVALLDVDGCTLRAERAKAKHPILLSAGYSADIHQSSLAAVIESGVPRILNDLPAYLRQHPNSQSTRLIVEEGMRSSVTLPLLIGSRCIGVLFFSSAQPHAYSTGHIDFLRMLAGHIAESIDKGVLIGELVLSAVTGFAKLAELRDEDTGEHLYRMAHYARIIAEELSKHPDFAETVNESFIRGIFNFSPLHDIGKVGIPDGILLKPGPLTSEEFAEMRRHAVIGGDILAQAEEELRKKNRTFFTMAIEIARHHHEKYDGSGYPNGLSGDAIPLSARIVTVADVFDALTSSRPYKRAFSLAESRRIIEEGRGKHFDPRVVDAFFRRWDDVVRIASGHNGNAGVETDEPTESLAAG